MHNFSIVIRIWWKIGFSVTPLWGTISQHNFAHATAAQLLCYVQNFIVITLIQLGWEQNEISIQFKLRWENRSWNGPQINVRGRRCSMRFQVNWKSKPPENWHHCCICWISLSPRNERPNAGQHQPQIHVAFNHGMLNCFDEIYSHDFVLCISPPHCDGTGGWNTSCWRQGLPNHTRPISCLLKAWWCEEPGLWFNIKMTSYRYKKSHCGDKTILRPSYLYNGISYTGKMSSLYWIRAQDSRSCDVDLVLPQWSLLSQWETALHCNVVYHWLSPYTKCCTYQYIQAGWHT